MAATVKIVGAYSNGGGGVTFVFDTALTSVGSTVTGLVVDDNGEGSNQNASASLDYGGDQGPGSAWSVDAAEVSGLVFANGDTLAPNQAGTVA